MTDRVEFPDGFVWGAATAAFQIEGAASEDGRTPSIWDTFCRQPGRVLAGDTGDVACDHYHRIEEDLDLIASLGLPSYRFSVSWPRVIPSADGPVNAVGLDFYQRLVDGLLDRGITPLVTLYHWDLPQALQDAGGWLSRDTVDRFMDYVLVVGKALGDRVETFTTLNEPWCSAFLGYGSGVHAPGIADSPSALTAAHHLNLAHGRATSALRAILPSSAQIGITLNPQQVEAADPASEGDLAAARQVDAVANRIFFDPLFNGQYPDELFEDTAHISDWAFVRDGDLAEISAPIDWLGVNYYQPTYVRATSTTSGSTSLWPGVNGAAPVPAPEPHTPMGWTIEPAGLTRLLGRIHRDYPGVPLLVTENGTSGRDTVGADGRVHDQERIDYLRTHLAAVHAAISAGVDVRGYYVWSLLDNFEWAWGYSERFGIIHVDYQTQRRTPKDSALWFRDVISNNAVDV